MLNKLFYTALITTCLFLIDACIGIDCNCPPDVKDFFDYSEAELRSESTLLARESGWFGFYEIQDPEFIADAAVPSCRGSWLFGSAWACSCIEAGSEGLKFPVVEINIYSNADYTASIAAGESLNTIVEVRNPQTGEQQRLSDTADINELFTIYSDIRFSVPEAPSADTIHTFTVEVIKSDGDTITTVSEEITWR